MRADLKMREKKCVPIENSQILPDPALLWCNNVKPTALPANLGVQVDCFMNRGYLTGKRLRTPVLNCHTHIFFHSQDRAKAFIGHRTERQIWTEKASSKHE